MFSAICRLFLVIVLIAAGTLASFEAAAAPYLRLSILRSTHKHKIGKLHRPNYRPYQAYRHY